MPRPEEGPQIQGPALPQPHPPFLDTLLPSALPSPQQPDSLQWLLGRFLTHQAHSCPGASAGAVPAHSCIGLPHHAHLSSLVTSSEKPSQLATKEASILLHLLTVFRSFSPVIPVDLFSYLLFVCLTIRQKPHEGMNVVLVTAVSSDRSWHNIMCQLNAKWMNEWIEHTF